MLEFCLGLCCEVFDHLLGEVRIAEVRHRCDVHLGVLSGQVGGEGVDHVGNVDLVLVIGSLDCVEHGKDHCVIIEVAEHGGLGVEGGALLEHLLQALTEPVRPFLNIHFVLDYSNDGRNVFSFDPFKSSGRSDLFPFAHNGVTNISWIGLILYSW